MVAVDYYKLKEDGYAETGGGDALDLTVAGRDSDELAVSGTVAPGLDFGGADEYDGWTRFEIEAGRREIVAGSLGATIASFKDRKSVGQGKSVSVRVDHGGRRVSKQKK